MAEDENTSESHAEVSLVGKKLIVTPKSVGNHFFTLVAESNGRPVSKMVEVKVGDVVLFAKYSGTDVKVDGVEYKILSIKDALAIVE